jgi:hypothetical protein
VAGWDGNKDGCVMVVVQQSQAVGSFVTARGDGKWARMGRERKIHVRPLPRCLHPCRGARQ